MQIKMGYRQTAEDFLDQLRKQPVNADRQSEAFRLSTFSRSELYRFTGPLYWNGSNTA